MDKPSLLYTSFDVVPMPKGAAIHIGHFSRSIADAFGKLELVTVAPDGKNYDEVARTNFPQEIEQTEIAAPGSDLISRVVNFRRLFKCWIAERRFDVVHFRSPFEGLPIAQEKKKHCNQLIFEVNGLPSIELKYRYPNVADDEILTEKLFAQEQVCLDAADLIITTCDVTKNHLKGRGVREEKIKVIPNGVQLEIFTFAQHSRALQINSSAPDLQLLYAGTLSGWQGVELAIRALSLVQIERSARLTIIGPATASRVRALLDFATTAGVADRVQILQPVPQDQLVEYMHSADIILAPLTPNDRNLVQGCCPLKILEAMASGTPVIASDLPVVREIVDDTCLLVKSGSAGSLKDGILQIASAPETAARMAYQARKRIEERYTWTKAGSSLVECYAKLLQP